jgi:GAF domain-containing protein
MQMTREEILSAIASSPRRGRDLRELAMNLLDRLPDYDWSGVYRLESDHLVLDAYVGEETEHDRIPIGVGVCGSAVAEGRNQVVEDVRKVSNYLACSLKTRSEIVVLVREGSRVLGQIDVDGHRVGAFGAEDETFLERVAALLAARWSD